MPYTTSIADLRTLINDGPQDKLVHRKRVFGIIDGTNTVFKTFETRRLTNLVEAKAPFGVYVGPTQAGTFAPVTSDNPSMGEFVLTTAPTFTANTVVEATFYYQWFLDSELEAFLKTAAQWLSNANDITTTPDGLQPAAIHHAAHTAYKKMSTRATIRQSDIYMLQDKPGDGNSKGPVEQYLALADQFFKDATEMRDDYYQRNGQPLSPLFGSISGRVRSVTPIR